MKCQVRFRSFIIMPFLIDDFSFKRYLLSVRTFLVTFQLLSMHGYNFEISVTTIKQVLLCY
jgi:hypothetical protein